MLVIENIRNIKEIYNVNKNESINCEVKFQCFNEYVPYTASINDSEEIGRNIHHLCLSGVYGEIYPPLLPTLEDKISLSETERNLLLLESFRIIEPLKDANEGGYIDEEDIDKLEKWKKYRYHLTKVNLEEENIQWPQKPD